MQKIDNNPVSESILEVVEISSNPTTAETKVEKRLLQQFQNKNAMLVCIGLIIVAIMVVFSIWMLIQDNEKQLFETAIQIKNIKNFDHVKNSRSITKPENLG